MPRVRFEPTISVFEQAKIFHALDRGYCDRRNCIVSFHFFAVHLTTLSVTAVTYRMNDEP
jgi:hypothetical protein